MDRRSFLKSMFAAVFLPFLPKGLSVEKEQHEVWLQSSLVAGFKYYDGEKVWYSLKVGELLALSREPNNPHDNQAVEVLWRGHKLDTSPGTKTVLLLTCCKIMRHCWPEFRTLMNPEISGNRWSWIFFCLLIPRNKKDASCPVRPS